jgi:hypothetical protein
VATTPDGKKKHRKRDRLKPEIPTWIAERPQDAKWLKIERWVELANNPPGDDSSPINFGVRGSRIADDPELTRTLANTVREVLSSMAQRLHDGDIDRYEPDPFYLFVSALERCELLRIRRCGIEDCRNLFYAKRILQKGCSTRCAAALRQRRSREKGKEYEQNRKRNRAAKIQQSKLKTEARSREFKTRLG